MLANFEILTNDDLPSFMPRSEAEATIEGFDNRITALENAPSFDPAELESEIQSLQINKADNIHTHTWSSITGRPTLFSGAYADLTGKPNLFSGNYNELTNKPTIPALVQGDWDQANTTANDYIKNKPEKVFPFEAIVANGNAVFYLTKDGTANGAAFFPNGPNLKGLQLTAEEGTTPHAFGVPALSNGNKTLTVPVSKVAPILGILNVGQPANGSKVRLLISGAS